MSDKIWFIDYIVDGKRVCVGVTQERIDLAMTLALNPELVKRLNTETMTLREEEVSHGTKKKSSPEK
jgi:hypothetical protein